MWMLTFPVLKFLGEEGANCKLDGAVVVSNPWNLDISNMALQRSFLGKNIYSTVMGTSMKELFERYELPPVKNKTEIKVGRHHEQIMKHNPSIDAAKVRSLKYLHEFDR